MKFSKWILGAALLVSAQVASVQGKNAYDSCNPCAVKNPCDLCDIDFCEVKYNLYVDALYWQVGRGDLNLGRDSHGTEKYLTPDFSWGYRVGGEARWRNWDLGLRWTSYTNSTKRELAYTSEHAKFNFDYRVLDVELGYTCAMDCGPFTFRPLMGAKLAWIDDHFNKHKGGQSNSKLEYEGYGLYIGAGGRWELCNYATCDMTIPISLVARASAGVMHSQFSQKVTDPAFVGHRNLDWETIYTAYNDVYVGLDFAFQDMCGWDAFFQVGYEAQNWDWREYNNDEDVSFLGLGGLVLRFGADF